MYQSNTEKDLQSIFILSIIYAFISWTAPLLDMPIFGSINLFTMGFNFSNPIAIMILLVVCLPSVFFIKKQLKDASIISFYLFLFSAFTILYFRHTFSKIQDDLDNLSAITLSLFTLEWGSIFIAVGSLLLAIMSSRYYYPYDRRSSLSYGIIGLVTVLSIFFSFNSDHQNFVDFDNSKNFTSKITKKNKNEDNNISKNKKVIRII